MLRLAFDRLINSIQKIGILGVGDMVRRGRGQMGSAPFAVRLERAFPVSSGHITLTARHLGQMRWLLRLGGRYGRW